MITLADAEFKEFQPRLKYGWFHFLYLIVQDFQGFWGI